MRVQRSPQSRPQCAGRDRPSSESNPCASPARDQGEVRRGPFRALFSRSRSLRDVPYGQPRVPPESTLSSVLEKTTFGSSFILWRLKGPSMIAGTPPASDRSHAPNRIVSVDFPISTTYRPNSASVTSQSNPRSDLPCRRAKSSSARPVFYGCPPESAAGASALATPPRSSGPRPCNLVPLSRAVLATSPNPSSEQQSLPAFREPLAPSSSTLRPGRRQRDTGSRFLLPSLELQGLDTSLVE